jgi:hypothetical protein
VVSFMRLHSHDSRCAWGFSVCCGDTNIQSSTSSSCLMGIFFWGGSTAVWTQGFVFAKQAFYCLSHTSSPFYSGYFGAWGGESCELFA